MHEIVDVPLADLQLDARNARLGAEQATQQATALELAKQEGRGLITMAQDIVKHRLDPTNIPAVVATGDRLKRYRVIEGNRRVLTLKALETPSLISSVLGPAEQRRFAKLARQYADNPIDEVTCVLFDTEEEALHWVWLRHTGANEGAGLSEWDANEKDRFRARHSSQGGGPGSQGRRQTGGQAIDFVDRIDGATGTDNRRLITNVQRLVNSPTVREALGLDLINGVLVSRFPAEEVTKGLRRILRDLRDKTVKVGDIYLAEDRRAYIEKFGPDDRPDPATALPDPIPLDELTVGSQPKKAAKRPATTGAGAGRRDRKKGPRTTLVPTDCKANVTPPRVNAIYNELMTLNVEQYPNACAVLLRVFLELSVDHEVRRSALMTEQVQLNTPLSKRIKAVTEHLEHSKVLPTQLRRAIDKIADSQDVVAASAITFNQYVHNQYVHPKPSELRTAWDELQPFLEKLWP